MNELLMFIKLLFWLTIPGFFLIKTLLKDKWNNIYLLYSVPLSIALMYVVGLGLNYLGPLAGIDKPLDWMFVTPVLTVLTVIFGVFSLRKLKFPVIHFPKKDIIFVFSFFIISLLASFGAIRLNNEAGNQLTIAMLLIAPILIVALTFCINLVKPATLVTCLYLLAVSLTLMLSLRSWHISGFDISTEFYVFKLTHQALRWDINSFRNAYNACLSLNILPTIISELTSIPSEWVFKFAYPLIYSYTVIIVFYIASKVIGRKGAFLAGIFFMLSPWFIDPMITITRQQIAFLFFGSLVVTILDNNLSKPIKTFLIYIFGISMVISHYSTTYIAIYLISSTYIVSLLISLALRIKIVQQLFKNTNIDRERPTTSISLIFVIFIWIFTAVWYSQATNPTSYLANLIQRSFSNIKNVMVEEKKSAIVSQVLNIRNSAPSSDSYFNYISQAEKYYQSVNMFGHYDSSITSKFTIVPIDFRVIPVINYQLRSIGLLVEQNLIYFFQAAVGIGVIYYLFNKNYKGLTKLDFLYFGINSSVFFAAFLILPFISQSYNLDRLYMQLNFVFSTYMVIGFYALLQLLRIPEKLSLITMSITMMILFAFIFGPFWQFIGGRAEVWINNFGQQYSMTYTHLGEELSAEWLGQECGECTIFADSPGRNKLRAYSGLLANFPDMFPQAFFKLSYIYETSSNVNDKLTTFVYRGANQPYQYPTEFVHDYKNLVYSNKDSQIYK